jgi:hypothetical protein
MGNPMTMNPAGATNPTLPWGHPFSGAVDKSAENCLVQPKYEVQQKQTCGMNPCHCSQKKILHIFQDDSLCFLSSAEVRSF